MRGTSGPALGPERRDGTVVGRSLRFASGQLQERAQICRPSIDLSIGSSTYRNAHDGLDTYKQPIAQFMMKSFFGLRRDPTTFLQVIALSRMSLELRRDQMPFDLQ